MHRLGNRVWVAVVGAGDHRIDSERKGSFIVRHQRCWNGGAEEQIDIDFRVEWLVVLDILDAGPLWRADEGKRRTRQPEAGGAVRRKFSSHDSSGFYARHVFDEAMLGRSAAGSSEETGNGRRDGEPLSPL